MKGLGRTAAASALLGLLAVSGYIGSQRNEAVQTVSVPVVFEPLHAGMLKSTNEPEAGDDLDAKRERALALLEEVIADPRAPENAVESALEEKTRLAAAMVSEARLEEALGLLGIHGAKAVAGARMMTVFAPPGAALDGKARMQIVDAAVTATGLSADGIKIILAKNE